MHGSQQIVEKTAKSRRYARNPYTRPHMKLDTLSLQELIGLTADGNHASFAQLYARTHTHLFGVAVRILGNGQSAEDVLQEAYVSIWKSAGGYRSEVDGQTIQPMTWLIAVVRNKALDALRQRARRKESELSHEDEMPSDAVAGSHSQAEPSALQLLDQATDALHIGACMGALEGSYRQSLALAYYQGLSHTEVALQMGAPLGSVKAWIRRGLEKLKACLANQGVVA